ncbi:glycosyltransferase [uncultured Erythrobacter sp.]|uniref:glycosyltransferase n=1 Tax=uncultured Erythrobacter sp. TaxID=263913 RepID=UPI00262786FE|nr:glycosyltransferase [uncultured Erythrobacter sp.]
MSTLYPNAVNPRFGTFVARSLEGLAKLGAKTGEWRVSVVNPIGLPPITFGRYRALSELESVAQEGGMTIYRPPFTLIPKIGGRRNAGAIAKAILPLTEQIHADRPIDVIDAQFFFPDGPAAAMVAQQLGLPLSIKARGSDISLWGEQDFARDQMLEAARYAKGLLAVSEALKGEMIALGMPGEKIEIHYTGLDRDRFRPLGHTQLRSQLGQQLGFAMPLGAPLLACVGALIERKGQDIAISALPSLPEARLILVGKGEDQGRLEGLARDLGVSDRVHFAGSLDHDVMPLILSAADATVLPTVSEGLANAWVESIACGTPVITTDVGGARELINNDIAGRLIERTPEAVVEAVESLLAAPPNPESVAASAERFSWDNNAAELAAYFERLVAG